MLETAKGSSGAINPFENALKQLDEAAKLIKLDKGLQEVLANPKRVLTVSLPIKMDNGEIRVFTGYRSQHNDAGAHTREAYAITHRSPSMRLRPYLCG